MPTTRPELSGPLIVNDWNLREKRCLRLSVQRATTVAESEATLPAASIVTLIGSA
jgi:hypothetical protein